MKLDPPKALLLIVNPTAGRRRGLVDAVASGVRREGWTVGIVETRAAGDARRLAEACDAHRYGMIESPAATARSTRSSTEWPAVVMRRPPSASCRWGTANVLAHELGLGFSAAVARTMTSGGALYVHPGEAVNGTDVRCFSLMAGAGFDAKVVAGVSTPLKRRLGRAAYVWRSLIEARRYKPVRNEVEIDGARHEVSSVIVTRSRH